MQLNKKNKITTAMGTYHRAMETPTNIFFINFEEGDKDLRCKMFDRKMKLISENASGYDKFIQALNKLEYSWVSKQLKDMTELVK